MKRRSFRILPDRRGVLIASIIGLLLAIGGAFIARNGWGAGLIVKAGAQGPLNPLDLALETVGAGTGIGFDSLDLNVDVYTATYTGADSVIMGCNTQSISLGVSQASQVRFGVRDDPGENDYCNVDIFLVATVLNNPAANNKNLHYNQTNLLVRGTGARVPCDRYRCTNGVTVLNPTCPDIIPECPSGYSAYYPIKVAFFSKRQPIGIIPQEGFRTFALDSADAAELQILADAYGANNLRLGVNYTRSVNNTRGIFAYTGSPVSFTINPTSQSFPVDGGTNQVSVTTANQSCRWRADVNSQIFDSNFISLVSGGGGANGNGVVTYRLSPNGPVPRTDRFSVAGQSVTVTQAGLCAGASTPTAINLNQLLTGQLSTTDCDQGFGDYADFYRFSGLAGQQIAITLTSTAFLPRVGLFGPSGEDIGNNFMPSSGDTMRIPSDEMFLTLPRTGNYLVRVDSFQSGPSLTGSYSLFLRGTGETGNCTDTSSIRVGQITAGQLSTTDCLATNGFYGDSSTFFGTEGDQLSIGLNSTDFDAFLLLFGPPGVSLLIGDNNGGGGTNARIPAGTGVYTLPLTGQYMIVASSNQTGQTGNYTLSTRNICLGVTTNPTDQTICPGGSVTFTAAANGATGQTVQWQVATGSCSFFDDIPGATGNSLTLSNVNVSSNGKRYRAFFSGLCGSTVAEAASAPATLTVNSFTLNPLNQSFSPLGGTGSIAVTATAAGSCARTAVSNNPTWITVTSGGSGSGSGTVGYSVAPNSGPLRTGSMTIGGQQFFISQSGCPAITVNPATAPAGTIGSVYPPTTFTASVGVAPFTCSVNAGALPPGLSLVNCVLSGTPAQLGVFTYTVRMIDSQGCSGTRQYTTPVNCPAIVVNPSTIPPGALRVFYTQSLNQTGGVGAVTFSVSAGSLPPGLGLSTAGVLSGVPAQSGDYNFTIRATDANGCQGTRSYSLTILGLQYYPLPRPIRLLDTRQGATGCFTPGAPLQGGTTRIQQALGTCDNVTIPSSAQAIVGNATVVNFQSAGGFITLWPAGAQQPTVSNLNYTSNQIIPNAFTVGLGAGGEFNIFAGGTTNFIVDITGYYAPPGTGGLYYHPLPRPIRLLETRQGETGCFTPGAPLATGSTRTQPARITCNNITIPANAQAVVGNATVVNFQSPGGFITLWPAGAAQPTVSNLNYTAGQIIPNAFTVGLGASGEFNIFAGGATNFIVDLTGYFSPDAGVDVNGVTGLLYNPLPRPIRLLETRPGETGCDTPQTPLAGGQTRTQAALVTCDNITIPTGARAVVGNATVVNFISGGGFITLWPAGAAQPTASNLNYQSNLIIPNAFTVGLGASGQFNIFASASTHFIVDLTGFFAP